MNDSFEDIKGYKIQQQIGEGGMGRVFKAFHPTLKRTVALKSMLPSHYNNPEARLRFSKDGEIISLLKHPCIIQVYDYFEDHLGMYLVMEFFEGVQLDEYILRRRGLIPHNEAIQIMTKLLDGLDHAHSKGVIHRDIKPANILIDEKGNIKIIDFGVAELIDEEQNLAKTMSKQASGSPYYMSPEQILCKKQDYRTDIYSAGLVLYFMVTGKNPFDGVGNYFELQKKKVDEELPPPSSFYPMIPSRLDRLIDRAMAKEPSKRFQSCREFSKQLQDLTLIDEESTFRVLVQPQVNALIHYAGQGETGSSAVLILKPEGAQLTVLGEGFERYSSLVGLSQLTNDATIVVNLKSISQKKDSKNLFVAGLVVLAIGFLCVLYLLTEKLNLIEDLQTNLNWYKQNC